VLYIYIYICSFVDFVDLFPCSRFILIVRVVVGRLSSFRSVRTASGREYFRMLVGSYLVEICFDFA
jgi:hypothetical protein